MNKVLLSFLILIQSNYSSNQNFFTDVILKSNSSMAFLSLLIGVPMGLTMTLLIEKNNRKERNRKNLKNDRIEEFNQNIQENLQGFSNTANPCSFCKNILERYNTKRLQEKGIQLDLCDENELNQEKINLDTSLKNIIQDGLFKNPKLLILPTALLSLNIFGIQFFIKWFLKIK